MTPNDWGDHPATQAPAAPNDWGDHPAAQSAAHPGALEQIGTSLKSQAKGLFDTLSSLVDPAVAQRVGNGVVDSHIDQWNKAKEAYKSGDHLGAVLHGLGAAVPIVGPMINNVAEKATTGGRPYEAATDVAVPAILGAALAPAEGAGEGVPIIPKVKPKLTPEAESAVNFADQNRIPIDAGTRTGDKFVKNVQAIAQNQPIASGIATRAQAATRSALTRTGDQMANEVHPAPMSPEDAGGHVQQELGQLSKIQQQGATQAYGRLEKIEADPQHARQVQVGTRKVPGSADQSINGTPSYDEPVMKSVALPVDMGPAIDQLKPVLDQIKQQMPVAQQQASRGLQAIDNIVNGDRIQPASVADQNLSALKQLQREKLNPKTMRLANAAVDAVAPLVDKAVAKAGPDATDALNEGRALTKAKYATDATIDQLPLEPVKLFDKLTTGRDTNINLLRDVTSKAPTSIPAVGRAALEGLFEKATAAEGKPGAGTARAQWNKMGDSTKSVLYPDPALRTRLDNFFNLAEQVSKNPNPSGTATTSSTVLSMGAGGMIVRGITTLNPWDVAAGSGALLAWPAITKMLYSQDGANLLMSGLRVPITNKAVGGIIAGAIMRASGGSAKPVALPLAASSDQSQPSGQQTTAAARQ